MSLGKFYPIKEDSSYNLVSYNCMPVHRIWCYNCLPVSPWKRRASRKIHQSIKGMMYRCFYDGYSSLDASTQKLTTAI
jgi:hypothetical protein